MTPRTKKLLGTAVLLPALFFYVFVAAAIFELLPETWWMQAPFALIAGVVWVFPLKPLLQWMNAPPKG